MDADDTTWQMAAILDAAPDAMIVIDGGGRIVHINVQAEQLFGYTRAELLGGELERLIPARFHARPPGHSPKYALELLPRPMGAEGGELHGQRKDGTAFPAEVSLSPLTGEPATLVIVAVRDGTARKRVEEMFRRLLEAAPDAMVIVQKGGVISRVNAQAERLFGYDRAELVGQPVEMLMPERYRGTRPSHCAGYLAAPRARAGDGARGLELFGLRKDGTEFPAEFSLSPLDNGEGQEAITAIRDLTALREAETDRTRREQAEAAVRLRDEFLSIASHELKTPLAAIKMQADGILRKAARSSSEVDRLTSRVGLISRAADRLTKLIDQLLDLSRITGGRLALERADTDLAEIARQVATQFADELSRSGSVLTLEADDAVLGSWDPLRIEQIISNLLGNAIKYGQGKPITVSVEQRGERAARLVVRDHGLGIPPEHQGRIFLRFERAVSARNYGGFGLGLWIVRQIIEAHRGSIAVSSQPGAGSVFTVDLPLCSDEGMDPPTPPPAPAAKHVLVVDDDAMVLESVQAVLEDEGFTVTPARNGLEALLLLRAGLRPCVILLDLMMPVMDAVAFRAEQQRDPHLTDIPVCVLSAAANVAQQAVALGVTRHLRKPVEVDTMIQVVSRCCSPAKA